MADYSEVRTSAFTILPSSHERAGSRFPGASELEPRLRSTICSEVRFDTASKAIYATDPSKCRHVPIGLVIPVDEGRLNDSFANKCLTP